MCFVFAFVGFVFCALIVDVVLSCVRVLILMCLCLHMWLILACVCFVSVVVGFVCCAPIVSVRVLLLLFCIVPVFCV